MAIEVINTDDAPQAIGPYSQAVKVGGLVFTSGQIAIDPETGGLVSGEIEEQTGRVLENLRAVLEAAHCSLEDVVKVTVYLSNMDDFSRMNEIYAGFFHANGPARSTVEVSRLPKDVKIEIDAVAAAR